MTTKHLRQNAGLNQTKLKINRRANDESGRSMVEMLGTLAIMGVLAIGGIAGYRWAMDKYKANDILNEVRKRAVVASQQRFGGSSTINFAEYGENKVQGYALSGDVGYEGNNDFFTITVADVDKGICDKVISEKMPLAVDMWVANNAEECGDDVTGNDIVFAFSNTPDPNADVNAGTTTPQPPDPNSCPNEGEYRNLEGDCVKDTTECADNPTQFWSSGSNGCVECPKDEDGKRSVSITKSLEDACTKCIGARYSSPDDGTTNYCVYCPTGVPYGEQCCENGVDFTNKKCKDTGCTSDSECKGKVTKNGDGKAICDQVTGECKWGCKDNGDCKSGNFCNLNVSTTGKSCTQKPGRGTCQPATLYEETGLDVNGHTWYRSQDDMNWWSAENFCAALSGNKKLIDPKDYCIDEWSSIMDNGYGYCSKMNVGNGSYYGWTKRLTNSCYAFDVHAYSGYVNYLRRYNGNYALCE